MPKESKPRQSLQLALFEQGQPNVDLSPTKRPQLAALIEVLMIEIAAALAIGEAGDEQNHS